LLATRSTSAFELGTMEATWNGRFRNRLKKSALTGNEQSSCASELSSGEVGVRDILVAMRLWRVDMTACDRAWDGPQGRGYSAVRRGRK